MIVCTYANSWSISETALGFLKELGSRIQQEYARISLHPSDYTDIRGGGWSIGRGKFFDRSALSKASSVGIPSQNHSVSVSLVISM